MPTSEADSKPKKKKLPDWASQPFYDFIGYTEELTHILDMTIRGVSTVSRMPGLVKALSAADSDPEAEKRIAKATKDADFAQKEIDAGFPFLHNQATISIWSALESLLHTVLAQWILNLPDILQQIPLANVKVKIGDYATLDQEQQAYYLADIFEQALGAPLKGGVTRFEAVFAALGLGGSIDDMTRQTLYELQQVRNVILHKRGVADQKFCTDCPWLGTKPGDHVAVTHDMFERYMTSAAHYVLELIYRASDFFGISGIREATAPAIPTAADTSKP